MKQKTLILHNSEERRTNIWSDPRVSSVIGQNKAFSIREESPPPMELSRMYDEMLNEPAVIKRAAAAPFTATGVQDFATFTRDVFALPSAFVTIGASDACLQTLTSDRIMFATPWK